MIKRDDRKSGLVKFLEGVGTRVEVGVRDRVEQRTLEETHQAEDETEGEK